MSKKHKNNHFSENSVLLWMFIAVTTLFSLGIFLILFFWIGLDENNNINWKTLKSTSFIIIYVFIILSTLLNLIFLIIIKKRSTIKKSIADKGINYYFESLLSKFSIGLIIFYPNGKIVWSSNFIDERFGEKIINKDLTFFNDEINLEENISDFTKIFKKDSLVYRISFFAKDMIMIVQDITQEYSATHFYEIEKIVIGEAEIDNYQLFSSSFSDDELFEVQTSIKQVLDKLSKKYNFAYRQYMESKFLLITNRDNLNKMILNNFDEIVNKELMKIGNIKISLSIGFGADTSQFVSLFELAKEALYQSQTRGGDQITVMSTIEKTKRFGSKSEVSVVKSKTKIKNAATNFKVRLQNSKIKNVVVYGHKFADLDAIGAAYAIYEVAKSFGKNVVIQNQTFDQTGQKAIKKYLPNANEIFSSKVKIKKFKPDETMVVIVDCSEDTRVENPEVFLNTKTENVFIFDHHRVSELDKVVSPLNIYIETSASSASEIITELIQFNEFWHHVSVTGAQLLLNGIYLDTNMFKKSTSSRTFAAASILEDHGARIDEAISLMRISQETNEKIISIVSKCKEVKPGYWISYVEDIVPIDIVSMAADEILKIEGRKAAFVIAQLPKQNANDNNTYKLSARSTNVNVQLIAEAVGGGGHFNSAAAVSDSKNGEQFKTFVDNVIQAIVSSKE